MFPAELPVYVVDGSKKKERAGDRSRAIDRSTSSGSETVGGVGRGSGLVLPLAAVPAPAPSAGHALLAPNHHGFLFVCDATSMNECLTKRLFGLYVAMVTDFSVALCAD